MDSGTILSALIMLSICVIPFVILMGKRKNRSKQLYTNFSNLITQNGLAIGQYEACGDSVIGFDSESVQLFFIKQNTSTDIQFSVPINTITNCKIEKVFAGDSSSINQSNCLDKVLLKLTTRELKAEDSTIILFDNFTQTQLNGELQFGEKWSKMIQAAI